ncbi:zinc ribbon domain-containing protein [Acetatifactor muris]|uniref:Zinc-ribbon domain-containing protein n=1 Tax=Acetatifactor muris TaxID=879566 RepID=A0A2K4ZBW8_9FIRM|nr:zinc ribbon domain-containing protein [Acetatifactor muris]MCR2046479.1 zinc ribbon domain-containing protein [Acetatifactor muris]SOY27953.1 hypothetical protein AMURIS_00658 [Acetatifactor muris]
MYCKKCGTNLPEGAAFCMKCGEAVTGIPHSESGKTHKTAARGKGILMIGTGVAALGVLAVSVLFLIKGKDSDSGKIPGEETGIQSVASSQEDASLRSDLGGSNGEPSEGYASEEEVPEVHVRDIAADLAEERERQIESLYEQKILLREAVRSAVADFMEGTSFVAVAPREQFSVQEVLIDEVTGNPILSEGVKTMIQSASQGKSVEDICRDTLESAGEQIPDYLSGMAEGTLQDMVTDVIGVNLFSAVDFVNQWKNADDTPTVLLQSIVDRQRRDVYRLGLFLQQEEMNTAEIYKIAQIVYSVSMREMEIGDIAGQGSRGAGTTHTTLRSLAGQYAAVEAQLLFYTQVRLPEQIQEREADGADSGAGGRKMQGILQEYEPLAQTEGGNISTCYDVEGFQVAQKNTSQSGMLSEAVFGKWLGGSFKESGQLVEDQVQEERSALCNLLTDYLEEAWAAVSVARGQFMEKYMLLSSMADQSGDGLYFVDLYLEDVSREEELREAAEAYLDAYTKYAFDLECAYTLYDCFLSNAQAGFLAELATEREQTASVLGAFEEREGYSQEERAQRWNLYVSSYAKAVDYIEERGASLGTTPAFHSNGSMTVYGEGTLLNYTKEYTAESETILIVERGIGYPHNGLSDQRYYYDTRGNLMFIRIGENTVTCLDGEIVTYNYEGGLNNAQVWVNWAEKAYKRFHTAAQP